MDNSAHEKLQTLIIEYTKNLPNKIKAIEDQWKRLIKHWDDEQFADFYRDIHSLCGSAGTYGYSALSKTARELEIFLKTLVDTGELKPEKKQKISNMFEHLKKVAAMGSSEIEKKQASAVVENELNGNNGVYILTHDADLVYVLTEALNEAKYVPLHFMTLDKLSEAIQSETPVLLLIDIQNFEPKDYEIFLEIIKPHINAIPIFCIADQGNLLTRLHAIRLGSTAFYAKPVDTFYLIKGINQICGSGDDPYRVLIVDDSPSLAQYYSLILSEVGMKTLTLNKPLELMESISEFQPDLILMDVYMPECTGMELVALMRQDIIYATIPIIFLSTEDDKFKQLTALSMGGDYFLTKPVLPQHLVSAVKTCAKRAGLLNAFMIMDSLTGLLNHANILQHLEIEIARAIRQKWPLSFVMVDIDNFKQINDKFGHLVGDKVLKKIALFFQKHLRKTDSVGRYGGEEFGIILPGEDSSKALNIFDRLRERFAEVSFSEKNVEFNVTFSAGIASFPEWQTANELVASADEALYQAKNEGRNRVIVFQSKKK